MTLPDMLDFIVCVCISAQFFIGSYQIQNNLHAQWCQMSFSFDWKSVMQLATGQ